MIRYLSAEDIARVLRHEGDATVTARTVHYYAEQRLLPPPEYHGSRPRYTNTHLAAMRRARELRHRGHTLETIGSLLGGSDTVAASPAPATSARSQSVLVQPPAPPAPSRTRTLVVAPGLTLSASGWDDATLDAIVRAIQATLNDNGQTLVKGNDHGTSA